MPNDKFLIETDCPYMTPVPFRGKRNSSIYIPYIGRYKHNEFVIYGFSKWGMTLSEVAGQLISDLILEKKNA